MWKTLELVLKLISKRSGFGRGIPGQLAIDKLSC